MASFHCKVRNSCEAQHFEVLNENSVLKYKYFSSNDFPER